MAASLGFGHEIYTYPPASASCFTPDLVAANNCATTMNLLPPAAAMAGDYFPELGVQLPDYHSPPPPPQVFAENEMNMSFVDDGRRRRMSGAAGGSGHRPPSSRIGFRMRSEVDAPDDGFKWRKYGKKAVKGSPNPRNYYRCSTEGCGVKKLIERDRDDPRYVVTTYDGVHNHAAPAGRTVPGAAVHRATPRQAVATTLAAAPPPDDVWGTMQLHAAVAEHSSESSSLCENIFDTFI